MISIASKTFILQDITIQDDAFHKKKNFGHVETWYYDAMLDNNYSIVALVNVIHLGLLSRVLTGLFIYKDNKLIKSLRKKTSYRHFHGSEEKPHLMIDEKQILHGQINDDTKEWVFQVSLGDEQDGVDLEYIKTTTPWKGKTFLGDWLAIPRFNVQGTIFLDGKKISVSGEGYHDHNSYPMYAPFVNKGYHFGKIPFDSMNITWANLTKNRRKKQLLIVLNKDNKYVSINSDDIRFTVEREVEDHGKIIPTIWRLTVENDLLYLNIKIASLHFHYIHVPTVNYWRHHVRNTGEIVIDDVSRKIDGVEISEYLKFF